MATLTTSSMTANRARTSAARFWLILVLSCFVPLLILAVFKFTFEHRFAPKNMGIEGFLAQRNVGLLLIGSSHTRQGYDVARLEEETGVPAFLIAYDGTDLVAIDQIVSYLIDR